MINKTPHVVNTLFIRATPDIVWRCLTETALLNQWWCEIQKMEYSCTNNLTYLGVFRTTFKKDGKIYNNDYIYLEIIPNKKLSFTNALRDDLSPSGLYPSETITFELFPHEVGTRLVPDIKTKNVPELNSIIKTSSYDVWKYNLKILELLAEKIQQLTSQQPAPTPPDQP